MGGALLRGEEWQDRGERIDRKALVRGEMKHLPFELEIIAGLGPTVQCGALRRDDLDSQVIELE
jgi:hypothetical protein